MPYGEVYGGLQLKQIYGQVNPIFAIEEMKFYEVGLYDLGRPAAVHYDGRDQRGVVRGDLHQEQRAMLDSVIAELNDYIFEVQEQYNEERLEKIKQAKPDLKMIRLSEEERAAFKEASMEARKKFVEMTGDSGQKILDQLKVRNPGGQEERVEVGPPTPGAVRRLRPGRSHGNPRVR